MLYTILLYMLILFIGYSNSNLRRAILYVCILLTLYMGLRYMYPSDYPAYQMMFNLFTSPNYIYDADTEHMEYGWYILNRQFSFLGYYVFIFVQSCIYSYAVYLIWSLYANKSFFPIVALALVAGGGFETVLSAERQFVVAAICMIAFRYLLVNEIFVIRDLLKKKVLVYFIVVICCSYLHGSAYIVGIIPFLFLIPSRSIWIVLAFIGMLLFVMYKGVNYLPQLLGEYTAKYDYYSRMDFESEDYTTKMSKIGQTMIIINTFVNLFVYKKYNYNQEEKVVLLLAVVSNIFTLTGLFVGPINRLSLYFIVFSNCVYFVNLKYLKSTKFYIIYSAYIIINTLWQASKILSVERGSLYEYKFLLFSE